MWLLVGCTASLDLDELDARDGVDPGGAAGEAGTGRGVAGEAGRAGAGGAGHGGSSGSGGPVAGGSSAGASGASGALGGTAGAGGGAGGEALAGASGAATSGGAAGTAAPGGSAGSSGATAGAGGAGGAGAAGAPSLPICPREATAVATLGDANATVLDLHTNGQKLVWISSQSPKNFSSRPANLDVLAATVHTGPNGYSLDAIRLGATTTTFLAEGHLVLYSNDQIGTPVCTGDSPSWSLDVPDCATAGRLIDANGAIFALTGCGHTAVANAAQGPVTCGIPLYVDAAKAGDVGFAAETTGLALRDKLYTVEREGSTYVLREKTYPTSNAGFPAPPDFLEVRDLATIAEGKTRGLVADLPYLYTAVRLENSTGKWELRRYTTGSPSSLTVLYTGLDDLTAFAVVDGRVVFTTQGGAQGAGATIWRGAFGGQANGPAELLACLPVAPTLLQATTTHAFFADPHAVNGEPPSVRGVAYAQP
jgi:hypothetical protein